MGSERPGMCARQTVLVASASSKYGPHAHFTSGTHPRAQGLTRPRWPRWRRSNIPPVPPRTEIRLSCVTVLASFVAQLVKTDCSTEDPHSIPVSGRSPGEGNGNPLQYSCLENPMDRGAWQATVHRIPSRTRLSNSTSTMSQFIKYLFFKLFCLKLDIKEWDHCSLSLSCPHLSCLLLTTTSGHHPAVVSPTNLTATFHWDHDCWPTLLLSPTNLLFPPLVGLD